MDEFPPTLRDGVNKDKEEYAKDGEEEQIRLNTRRMTKKNKEEEIEKKL